MAFDFTSYNDNDTSLSDAFISDTDSSDLDSDRTITDNEMDESFLDNAVGDSVSAEESDSDDNFSFNIFVNRQFFLTTKKIEGDRNWHRSKFQKFFHFIIQFKDNEMRRRGDDYETNVFYNPYLTRNQEFFGKVLFVKGYPDSNRNPSTLKKFYLPQQGHKFFSLKKKYLTPSTDSKYNGDFDLNIQIMYFGLSGTYFLGEWQTPLNGYIHMILNMDGKAYTNLGVWAKRNRFTNSYSFQTFLNYVKYRMDLPRTHFGTLKVRAALANNDTKFFKYNISPIEKLTGIEEIYPTKWKWKKREAGYKLDLNLMNNGGTTLQHEGGPTLFFQFETTLKVKLRDRRPGEKDKDDKVVEEEKTNTDGTVILKKEKKMGIETGVDLFTTDSLENNIPVMTPCRHIFSYRSITKWLIDKNTCPLCMQKIKSDNNEAVLYKARPVDTEVGKKRSSSEAGDGKKRDDDGNVLYHELPPTCPLRF